LEAYKHNQCCCILRLFVEDHSLWDVNQNSDAIIVSFQYLHRRLNKNVELNLTDISNASDNLTDFEWEVLLNFREPESKCKENIDAYYQLIARY